MRKQILDSVQFRPDSEIEGLRPVPPTEERVPSIGEFWVDGGGNLVIVTANPTDPEGDPVLQTLQPLTPAAVRAVIPMDWYVVVTPTVTSVVIDSQQTEDIPATGFITTDTLTVEVIDGTLLSEESITASVTEDGTVTLTYVCGSGATQDFDPSLLTVKISAS